MKGTGWVPERVPRRAAGRVAGAFRAARYGALLQPEETEPRFDPWVLDQNGFGACTGFNAVGADYELTGFKGSPWAAWSWGRARAGRDPMQLPDEGVRSSAMLAAFKRHGSCALDSWKPGYPGFDYHRIPSGIASASAQPRAIKSVLPRSGRRARRPLSRARRRG